MKKKFEPRQIPALGTVTAVCALGMALWGCAIAAATLWRPWLGGIVAGTGVLMGAFWVWSFYGRLLNTNRELDRACRTRLLEKYLGG